MHRSSFVALISTGWILCFLGSATPALAFAPAMKFFSNLGSPSALPSPDPSSIPSALPSPDPSSIPSTLPSSDPSSVPITSNDRVTWNVRGSNDGQISETSTFIFGSGNDQFQPRSADECTPLEADLTGLPPTRNQGSDGDCFAYAAADVVSQALGEPVSALDLAFRYYSVESASNPSLGGGQIDWAILDDEPTGFCSETEFPSSIGQSAAAKKYIAQRMTDPDVRVYINADNEDELLPQSLDGLTGFLSVVKSAQSSALQSDSSTVGWDAQGLAPNFPFLGASQIAQILTENASDTPLAASDDIIDAACAQSRTKLPPSHILGFTPGGGNAQNPSWDIDRSFLLFPEIDQGLQEGHIVAISYDVGIIADPSLRKVFTTSQNADGHFWHASSIIGRRFDSESGSCQYLIRGTWGKTCQIYTASKRDQCDPTTGNIWVSENSLKSALANIYYLERN